ncbi:MAG: hypothetical protein ACLFN8_04590 [Candidatus Woesearchaeota archaeon]
MGCLTNTLKIGLIVGAGFGLYKLGEAQGERKGLNTPRHATYEIIVENEQNFLKNKETQNTYTIQKIGEQDYLGDAQHNFQGAYKLASQELKLTIFPKLQTTTPQIKTDTLNTNILNQDSVREENKNLIDKIKNYF